MKITSKMISDLVNKRQSRNVNHFHNLQDRMYIGRCIMKASDDQAGTTKTFSYRSRISEIEQYRANIVEGSRWLASVDAALENIIEIIRQVKEIAVSMANNTYDAAARDSMADQVRSLFRQMLQAGNLQQNSRYLFSGLMTRTEPFAASSRGVVYNGDQGQVQYEIETATRISINIPGSDIFTRAFRILGEDSDLRAGIDGNTQLADLNSGRGVDLSPGSFIITDQNLGNSVTVTIPPGTASIESMMAGINSQLAAAGIDNLTVRLGDQRNNLRLAAADKPQVSLSTPLANLNYGHGIGSEPYEIRIHSADYSTDLTVDLSAASTIGDVINEINATLVDAGIDRVTAGLNAALSGIDIEDTNIASLNLQVSEISNDSLTGAALHILGNISPLLSGQDLNPRPDFSVEEVAPGNTTAADIGLLGNFHYDLVGNDLDPQITPLTPLALINNGSGCQLDKIMISQGSSSLTVDPGTTGIATIGDLMNIINSCGLPIQASINENHKGLQVESTVIGRTLLIEDSGTSDTAYNLGIEGSPDVLGNLIFLVDAIRNNDKKPIGKVIASLDSSINHILNERASMQAKMIRLHTAESRLMDYSLELTKLLSETEGEDLSELAADLASHEHIFSAALNSAARIIQPSLMDFIR